MSNATLSNGQTARALLGGVLHAAEVEGMDPEANANLYTDLTAADAAKVLRAATPTWRETEWLQDWAAAVRWNAERAVPGEVVTRTARCLDMGAHDHDAVCFERTVTVGGLTVRLP
jgi:hypothetical protein